MKINLADLKQLLKIARFVAREMNDDDLFNTGYLAEALEDPEIFCRISADIAEETGEPLVLEEEE